MIYCSLENLVLFSRLETLEMLLEDIGKTISRDRTLSEKCRSWLKNRKE